MGGPRFAIAAAISVLVLGSHASAQPDEGDDRSPLRDGAEYLLDGGAIPFLWAPLVARIALDRWATPRETPLFFDESEGGAPRASWEIPGWGVTALGGAVAVAMLGNRDGASGYHVKGLAQALASGCLVTAALKLTFGRHRPDYDPTADTLTSHRSFPSGHSTQAFAIATYAALYLRTHVFEGRRGDRTLPWWEAATYGGLLVGASALAGERVLHHRHHLTDVSVGALLGTASSSLFFLMQERRFRGRGHEPIVTPQVREGGAGLGMAFVW